MIDGSKPVDSGASTQIQAALTGTAPWDVTWSDGVVVHGVSSSPLTRSVSPTSTTTYAATAQSGSCTATASGSAVVTVTTPPAAPVIWRPPLRHAVHRVGRTQQTGLTGNVTYLFSVRAYNAASDPASQASAYGNVDAATTILFTDDPISLGLLVKAVHVTELRTAINAYRAAVGLSAFTFTETVAPGTIIRAAHITEMRGALNAARMQLGLVPIGFTDPGLAAGSRTRMAPIQELRRVWNEEVHCPSGRIGPGGGDRGHNPAYTYDRFGNILTISTDGASTPLTLGVDPATNRMSVPNPPDATNVASGTYDGRGNMASYYGPGVGGQVQYAFDGTNMMTTLTGNGQDEAYIDTADDERIAAVRGASGSVTEWHYTVRDLGCRVLREFDDTQTGSLHLWKWKEDWVYRDGTLLAAETAGPEHTEHFHLDHLGTPRMITNFSGTQLSLHTYYPFGQEVTPWTDGEVMKYTGHERDLSLEYMHARHYNSASSRWVSVDPLGGNGYRPQTWNRYTYSLNDPVLYVDPTGMAPCTVIGSDGQPHPGDCSDVTAPAPKHQSPKVLTRAQRLELLRKRARSGDEGAMMALHYPAAKYGIEPTYAEFFVVAPLSGLLQKLGLAGGEIGLKTIGEEAVSDVGNETSSFFDGATFDGLTKMDPNHNFPEGVMAFEDAGTVTKFTGGDGGDYEMLTIPGRYLEKDGMFEFIKNSSNEVTHYFFNPTR